MIYGYASVSTEEQNLDRQLKQLQDHGCDYIFTEKISGATTDREQLTSMLDQLQEGDTVVATDLARITRSAQEVLVQILRKDIKRRKVS
ncbi:hypothetical protein COM96_15645 [Bacillus cereus]|uniref:Resolvase/invertase-type recombinase catalytic domain-containing protein n=1 Tax=Bacillus cereus TaxID=1396 RepID=A0A2A7HW78_BACCE|nr:hypothetical protein COM96_15645 [Bacillus cereus]